MANDIENPWESKKLCTEAKLAETWGVSQWTIRRWRLSEGLPCVKVAGRFFYRMESVERWLAENETAGALDEEPDEAGVIRAINV